MAQMVLPVVHRTVDEIEMGILEDGTPYLSMRALARVCGVVPSAILGWLPQVDFDLAAGRDVFLQEFLRRASYTGKLYFQIEVDGKPLNAVPDVVAMAVLEYFAFESRERKEQAVRSYRALAGPTLRAFIYRSLGYDPDGVPAEWRQFHDRLVLNRPPDGYFSVFTEMSSMVLEAIRRGLVVDAETVPDISVGIYWGRHWVAQGHDAQFGERQKWEHSYPGYFPQSASNPQDVWVYPDSALGLFRAWMRDDYLPTKYPRYLQTKVAQGKLPGAALPKLIALATRT